MNNFFLKNRQCLFHKVHYYFIILLTLGFNSGFAQTQFGIKTSYELQLAQASSMMFSNDGVVYANEIHFLENKNGQALGLFFKKDFSFLFVQADILYNQYDGLYMVEFLNESGRPPSYALEKFRNIDIGITAGYRLGNFDLGVGPILHRHMDLESELSQFDFYEDKAKNISAGFQFALGYNWKLLRLELKLEDRFSKVGEHIGLKNGQRNTLSNPQNVFKFQLAIGI